MAIRKIEDPAILLLRAQQVQADARATVARTMALRAEMRQVIALGRQQVAAGQARRQHGQQTLVCGLIPAAPQ